MIKTEISRAVAGAQLPQPQAAAVIPEALIDVALIDAKAAAAVGGRGITWWHDKVRSGDAPQPVIREPKCTRWKMTDVREFWRAYVERAQADPAFGATTARSSTIARAACQAKRAAARQAGA